MASLGRMRETIDILWVFPSKDKAGFVSYAGMVTATVRAYVEIRHASNAWVNRAAYTKADVLFRIRPLSWTKVSEDMEISYKNDRFQIDTVERVGQYIEILAHKIKPEGEVKE